MSDEGYVHIYTGDGKGKTTAAFGLALRAMLSGKKEQRRGCTYRKICPRGIA